MIDMQLLGGVLVALGALVGLAVVLSLAFVAAGAATRRARVPRPGPGPQGGIRRVAPEEPTPDADDARELVLR